MLNDHTSPLSLLLTRRSGRPREMVAPGPSDEQLATILTVAARTPDHGRLFPWRFVTVAKDQRQALADLLVRALPESDPTAGPAHYQKALDFAHHAPSLVVLVSSPTPGHKVPVWEQELSCGAAAMNLLHAATAMGFVGGWITGWAAYSPRVTEAFCSPGERIAGFLFLGTPCRPLEERPRPAIEAIASSWSPPA